MSSVVPLHIEVRPGRYEDAKSLGDLLVALARETPYTLMTAKEQEAALPQQALYTQYVLRSSNQALFVAVHNNRRIVGCINLSVGSAERNRHVCTLAMGVLKDYWGTGIASELVAQGVGWGRQKGASRYEVTAHAANDRAIRFYEKQGFVREGVRRQSFRDGAEWADEVYLGRLDEEAARS